MSSPTRIVGVRPSSKFIWLFGLALIAAAFVVYGPALHGGFLWDDDSWTTNLLHLFRKVSGLSAIWADPAAMQQYYPLTGTTFWLDYHFWKLWTFPYHVENVALHVLAALLFWKLLQRLEVPGAWLAAGIFVFHPVMVESVAWITERKNVLSMVLYLGALLAYGRFNGFWKTDTASRRRWGAYALAFILLVAALLAKTTTFSFPAVVLLIGWWKQGRLQWRRDILPSLPFFAVAAGLAGVTAWLEKNHVGAVGWEWDISLPQRCLIAGRAFWFYLGNLLFPVNLCFIYPRWQPDAGSFAQWLWPLAAIAALLALWLARGKIGRGPAAAAFYYVGTLFPVMGFLNAYGMRYSFVWDHWVYLSSLGIIALVAAGLAQGVERIARSTALFGTAAVLLPLLGFLTWKQTAMYSDLETLWRTTIARNPAAVLAYNNLGHILLDKNQVTDAIWNFNKALEINPKFTEPHNNLSDALVRIGKTNEAMFHAQKAVELDPSNAACHYNLGNAWADTGHPEQAIEQFNRALELDPDFAKARNNMGCAQLRLGRTNEALESFENAIQLDPELADAHNNMGNLLVMRGQVEEGMGHFRAALEASPEFPAALQNLTRLLVARGKTDEAIKYYEQALQAGENADFHNDLANLLVSRHRLDEAVKHYERAVQLNPGNDGFHYNLAVVLTLRGKLDEAVAEFRKTLALTPNSVPAHYRLALALQSRKDFTAAIAEYEETLRLDPTHATAKNNLAWLLATCPDASLRNGPRAVTLARETGKLAGPGHPDILDTLAAACAEAGQFHEAVETATEALRLAEAQHNTALATGLQARLKLYETNLPYHEPP